MFSHLQNFYNSETNTHGEGQGWWVLGSQLAIKTVPKFCFDLIPSKGTQLPSREDVITFGAESSQQAAPYLTHSWAVSSSTKKLTHFVFGCQVLLDSLCKSQDTLMETKQQDVPCDRIALSLKAP